MKLQMPKIKTVLITVAVLALLFIPTYIAIAVHSHAIKNPVTERAVSKITLTDPDGTSYTFEKGKDAESEYGEIRGNTISFFISLNRNSEPVSALPAAVRESTPFEVIYYSYNLESKYSYYFSTDATAAYYTDQNGKAYHVKKEDAGVFVTSLYALSLYKEAQAPVMTLGSEGSVILPQNMVWKYKLTDNEYANAVAPVSDEKKTFSVSGMPQLRFTREPDYFLVQVYNGTDVIFNDLYANLTSEALNLGTDNATLSVSVTAQWYQNETYGSYGEAFYNFTVEVRAPSSFYLGEPTVDVGDFVVISGKNVEDPSKITFTSSPDIGFTPVFFAEDDCVYALVPISYNLEYHPSYTFTLVYDDVQTDLTLNVNNKTFRTQASGISSNIIVATRTQTTLDAFAETMRPIFANQLGTRYWKDGTTFISPVGNTMIKTGFGLNISITATGTTYRHEGVNYVVNEGTTVYAACGGEVLFAGTTSLTGHTVVIDHGFGLKTLYCHMSSLSVTEGTVVSAGDALGLVGSTGFIDGVGFHFGMYVFDVPVSPYEALDLSTDDAAPGIPVAKP